MIKLTWDQSVYCTLEYKQIIYSFIFLLYLPKSVNMRTKIMKVGRPSFLLQISFTAIRGRFKKKNLRKNEIVIIGGEGQKIS